MVSAYRYKKNTKEYYKKNGAVTMLTRTVGKMY